MKSCEKLLTQYLCKSCDYSCSNKYNFNKHLTTAKHKMVTNGNFNGNKMVTGVEIFCETCGKCYKYKSGLSRHKKKCLATNNSMVLKGKLQKNPTASMKGVDHQTVELLTRALSKQGDLIEKLIENQNQMIPKLGNNNNNKISINVFLNEHCKNAMNLTDFVDNIKVSIEDLEYTNQHGYAKGISNIFTKHLTDLDVSERPIHCSDKKRLQFYIKDSDKWEKDTAHKKLDKTIDDVTNKQFWYLKEWEKENPDHLVDEKKGKIWLQMMKNLSGCLASEKTSTNIKKSISENITVKELIKNEPDNQ